MFPLFAAFLACLFRQTLHSNMWRYVFGRCTWRRTYWFNLRTHSNCYLKNLLKYPWVEESLRPFSVGWVLNVKHSDNVRRYNNSKRDQEEVRVTIVVKSKHLKNVGQNISIVKATNTNWNPHESKEHLDVPKITSFLLWKCFTLRIFMEIEKAKVNEIRTAYVCNIVKSWLWFNFVDIMVLKK